MTRLDDMLERYGEVCTQKMAGQILSIDPRTIFTMLQDGRLRRIGKRVDVRSIAEYIENAAAINALVRQRKTQPLSESDFYRAARSGSWAPRRR